MTWDLFDSAEDPLPPPQAPGKPARPVRPVKAAARLRRPAATALSNEELARTVAAEWADADFQNTAQPAEEWTVSRVNAALRDLVEGVLPPLWVVGEVTNFTRARSGHCYFTLRDANSQLRCVMWRDEARRLPTNPAEGMQVRALGRLAVYEARGELQFVVAQLEGKGEGLWKLALERLRVKLEAEGLTAPGRKRPLPRIPAAVGVITSPSGAVLHDIANVVRRRAPWTRLVLCGARVQGEGAAEEIAAAIRLMSRCACVDVLIVGRGGGSVEDLWAFNEEVVARAIADCAIPVISAVGHETDVTIADLVADLRAPTPSAAAEAAVPDGPALARGLRLTAARLDSCLDERLAGSRAALASRAGRLADAARRGMDARRNALASTARHLHALSPLTALGRGFAVPLDSDGRVLRRVADFPPGERFALRVQDGSIPCHVEESLPSQPRADS
jgi:exodeoxyribonuclease VII large subunit